MAPRPCFASRLVRLRHRLRLCVQRHHMIGVLAIERQQPVGIPDLGRDLEPNEVVRVGEFLRHLVGERRWRELVRIAKIGPDIAAEFLGPIGLYRQLASQLAVLRLPWDQHTPSVRRRSVARGTGPLEVAVEHPPDRQLGVAVRAVTGDHVGPAAVCRARSRCPRPVPSSRPACRWVVSSDCRIGYQ